MMDRPTRVHGDDKCWRCLSERMVSGPFAGRLKYLCRKCLIDLGPELSWENGRPFTGPKWP